MKSTYMKLVEAVDYIEEAKYGPRRRGSVVFPGDADIERSIAVAEIEHALRDGRIHAQGCRHVATVFEDIPTTYWQLIGLDPDRARVPQSRTPCISLTKRGEVGEVLYERLIFWREEIEKVWPEPMPLTQEVREPMAPLQVAPMVSGSDGLPWWVRFWGWVLGA